MGSVIRLAENKVGEDIISEFEKRSMAIIKSGFVEEEYKKFVELKIESYLRAFSGMGKWLSRFDKYLLKGKLLKYIYNKKRLLAIQNYIECEAHRWFWQD